jgi:hypothetical protein
VAVCSFYFIIDEEWNGGFCAICFPILEADVPFSVTSASAARLA